MAGNFFVEFSHGADVISTDKNYRYYYYSNSFAMFMMPMKPDVPKCFTSPEQNRDLWTSYHFIIFQQCGTIIDIRS